MDIYLGEMSFGPPMAQIVVIMEVVREIPTDHMAGSVGDKVKVNRRNALINRLEAVSMEIQTAETSNDPSTINTAYQSAIDQLNSTLNKMDGFAERRTADTKGSGYTPDWIIISISQGKVDPLIRDLIVTLEDLLIP